MEVILPYPCTSTTNKKRPRSAFETPGQFSHYSSSKKIRVMPDDGPGTIDNTTSRNILSIRSFHPSASTASISTSSSSSSSSSSFSSASDSGSDSGSESDLDQSSDPSDSSIDDSSDDSSSTSSSSPSPSPSSSPSLQSRLSSFLPTLAAANRQLSLERQEGRLSERNIENIAGEGDEDGEAPYIEMNLGLGVLKERRNSDEDASSSSSSDSDSDSDSTPQEKDILRKLMGREKRREKPGIQVMDET